MSILFEFLHNSNKSKSTSCVCLDNRASIIAFLNRSTSSVELHTLCAAQLVAKYLGKPRNFLQRCSLIHSPTHKLCLIKKTINKSVWPSTEHKLYLRKREWFFKSFWTASFNSRSTDKNGLLKNVFYCSSVAVCSIIKYSRWLEWFYKTKRLWESPCVSWSRYHWSHWERDVVIDEKRDPCSTTVLWAWHNVYK